MYCHWLEVIERNSGSLSYPLPLALANGSDVGKTNGL